MCELPTGLVAFLFTDIEGSTRLLQRFGDAYDEVLENEGGTVCTSIDDPLNNKFLLNPFDTKLTTCGADVLSTADQAKL